MKSYCQCRFEVAKFADQLIVFTALYLLSDPLTTAGFRKGIASIDFMMSCLVVGIADEEGAIGIGCVTAVDIDL